jgi:hypothetical protein
VLVVRGGSEITTGEDKVTKRGRKYGGKIIVVQKRAGAQLSRSGEGRRLSAVEK